jgi:hypothetical protein
MSYVLARPLGRVRANGKICAPLCARFARREAHFIDSLSVSHLVIRVCTSTFRSCARQVCVSHEKAWWIRWTFAKARLTLGIAIQAVEEMRDARLQAPNPTPVWNCTDVARKA